MPNRAREEIDYGSIRLKVGLEVHMQLATKTKLFCSCPPFSGEGEALSDDADFEKRYPIRIKRILRPATSELGELDEAARFESRREIKVTYVANQDSSCLVEADEEPPHPISSEALDTALIFSLALNSRIADEIHVMRKIVVDGSNTSGFQRTAVVALGGTLDFDSGRSKVGVQSISVEEDAARSVNLPSKESGNDEARTYALDRLGTPLVEVALSPIEREGPEQIEKAASSLGRLMRSSDRIARGLGTIRQDLNISVMDGSVIEVKGVQRLEQIGRVVRFEASRQKFFFDLSRLISSRIGRDIKIRTIGVSDVFHTSESKVIKDVLARSSRPEVSAIVIDSFSGFLGMENENRSRLGKELGAIARTYGIGGIFHSDELPAYGISKEEVVAVKKKALSRDSDAFVLVAGESDIVGKVVEALTSRIREVATGVPAETRSATEDGETIFLRPRPGAARMYPETDIPLIGVEKSHLFQLRKEIPEPSEVVVDRFSKKYDLPPQLAEPVLDSDRKELFVDVLSVTKLPPRYVASVLVDSLQSISREGLDVSLVSDLVLKRIFSELDSGNFAKEAVPQLLRVMAREPELSFDVALSKAGAKSISKEELRIIVEDTIKENEPLIRQKKEGSESTLMGKVMKKVRGKADGKVVNEEVKQALMIYLERTRN